MHAVGPDLDHDVAMSGSAVQVFECRAAVQPRRADEVADLRGIIAGAVRQERGARRAGPQHHALDVDRVARVGTEQVARHAGTRDVPGDEGRRPRHLGVEAAEVRPVDAPPVVVDALRRVALLDAVDRGAWRRVREVDRLAAEACPFLHGEENHRDARASHRRRRLGCPGAGRAGPEGRQRGRWTRRAGAEQRQQGDRQERAEHQPGTTITPRGDRTRATLAPAERGRSTLGQVANNVPAAVAIEYSMCVPR